MNPENFFQKTAPSPYRKSHAHLPYTPGYCEAKISRDLLEKSQQTIPNLDGARYLIGPIADREIEAFCSKATTSQRMVVVGPS